MTDPQKKSKANDLINRVNELSRSLPPEKNRFVLRGLKTEAETLLKSDAFSAYVVLGAITCLENKIDEMRKNHLKALKLEPRSVWGIMNYAFSLKNRAFTSEAIDQVTTANQIDPTDLDVLSELIKLHASSGSLRKAKSLLLSWKKLSPDRAHDSESFITSGTDLLEKNNVSDDQIQKVIATALDIFRRRTKSAFRAHYRNSEGHIDYVIGVDISPKDVVNMNIELADSLAANDLIPSASRFITAMYMPERHA